MYFSSNTNSNDTVEQVVILQPISETKRKVSIQTEPTESRLNYDSLGYDLHSRRKISQVTMCNSKKYCDSHINDI